MRTSANLGGVDADPVGWQNAGLPAVVQADVEAHDRVPRVDSLDVTALTDPRWLALIATVAEVLVAWQPGSARRRRSAADRPAGKLAGLAVGAGERAVDSTNRGNRIQTEIAGGSRVDLFEGRPAPADPHDRHDPAQGLGHLQRLLGRVERDDRNLILGHLDRNRLFGLFQVDHLGDEPAAVDDVPQFFIGEDDPDRVLGRADLPGPVQVPHNLDHGKEFNSGTLGDVAQPQAVADSALKADRRDALAFAIADGRRAGFGCQDLDPQSRGPLEADDLDLGVESRRTLRAVSFGRDDRANRRDTGPKFRPWRSHWHSWRDAGRRLGGSLGRSARRGGCGGRRSRILSPGAHRSGYRHQAKTKEARRDDEVPRLDAVIISVSAHRL